MLLTGLKQNNKGIFILSVAFIFIVMFLLIIALDTKIHGKLTDMKKNLVVSDTLNTKKAILLRSMEKIISFTAKNTLKSTQEKSVLKQNIINTQHLFNAIDLNIDLTTIAMPNIQYKGSVNHILYDITFTKPYVKKISLGNLEVYLKIKRNTVFTGDYHRK